MECFLHTFKEFQISQSFAVNIFLKILHVKIIFKYFCMLNNTVSKSREAFPNLNFLNECLKLIVMIFKINIMNLKSEY